MDWDGKPVSSKDLVGKWVLLYFGFTKCPDICPDELHKVTAVLKRLENQGQSIQPVFITIDPTRDTKARLKSYFETAGFHPRFIARWKGASSLARRQDCFGQSCCETHVHTHSGTRSTRASIATDGGVADTTWLYTDR